MWCWRRLVSGAGWFGCVRVPSGIMRIGVALFAFVLLAAGCGASTGGSSAPPSTQVAAVAVTTAAPGPATGAATSTTTVTTLAFDAVRQETIDEQRRLSEEAYDALRVYHRAIVSRNGELVTELVTQFTIEWFDEVRELAQNGDRTAFAAAPLSQAIRALELRLNFRDGLQTLRSGADTLAALVVSETIGVLDIDSPDVRVVADDAELASVLWRQRPVANLRLENGAWRFDLGYDENLVSVSANSDEQYERAIIESLTGIDANREALFEVLEAPITRHP